MTTRRRKEGQGRNPDSLPSQEDEADILEEANAERDEEGHLVVDEETVRDLGAVDAASVRANRRSKEYVGNKRGKVKDVRFTTDDLLEKYEAIIGAWPPNTLDITVIRRTGTPAQYMITSRPRSGAELHEAIRALHGQQSETEYEIKIHDANGKQYRGNGRITMPDTRPPTQQGQPMQQYPYGVPPAPPGYPPQPQPAAPPAPVAAPQAFDPMAMFQQMFQMIQQMQATVQPPTPPQYQPPIAPVMPPMPSPQASPAEMMAWFQQAFGLFQQMQAPQSHGAAPVQPPPSPPPSPQSNLTETMAVVKTMFDMFRDMQGAAGGGPPSRGGPFLRPPPRQGHYPQGEPPSQYPPYQSQPQPPPRPQTVAEQFREAMTVVRTASEMANEVSSMFPGQQSAVDTAFEEDDSPMRVIDTGPAKIVVNKDDGRMRPWETGLANLDKIFKWVGEQHEVIQKVHRERQLQPRPRQQLPPGFVEVGPDYKPPPGYIAVQVDEQDLPPPPEEVPPPIESAPRRTWGAPPMPEEGEG